MRSEANFTSTIRPTQITLISLVLTLRYCRYIMRLKNLLRLRARSTRN